jgi:L-glutamine-phosphate cytidylyltransferase
MRASTNPAVILLGAGRGSRLFPYTADRPKWLLPIRGRPVLHYLTAMAHHAGATNVQLVRGLAGGDPGLPCIGIIENPNDFNMVDSLFKAEAHFGTDFIMSYADIVYEPRVFDAVCSSDADVAVAIDRAWLDYYTFRCSDPYSIAETLRLKGDRIVEIGRAIAPVGPKPEGQYIGLVRFQGEGVVALSQTYHGLAAEYWGKPWRHASRFESAFMTDLLQELIDRGIDVRAVPFERGWLEFDTREDYERVGAADSTGELERYIHLASLPSRPTVLSAGGVVSRVQSDDVEVMVVAQGSQSDWRLPKGMQESGEAITRTAEREVAEETGVLCRTGDYLGCSSWTYVFGGQDWDEIARFYLMHATGGRCQISDSQILAAAWMSIPTALQNLKYEGERESLRTAAGILTTRL